MTKVLALDLGTKTGWALQMPTGERLSGTKLLLTPKEQKEQKAKGLDRCCDSRPVRLWEFIRLNAPDLIAFEDVQFMSTQMQAQLWGSLRGVVQTFYPERKILAVPVGTLKKFATGSGAAKKWQMAAGLALAEPRLWKLDGSGEKTRVFNVAANRDADDNEVDAVHLLRYAIANPPK